MAAGVFGYLGYDMVRLMEDTLAAPAGDPIGIPDAIICAPHAGDRVRCRRRYDYRRHARCGRKRRSPRRRRWRMRASDSARLSSRSIGRSANPQPKTHRGPAQGSAAFEHYARRFQAHGGSGQGVHCSRRYFSGGAVAAVRSAVSAAAVRALPRASPGQPVALSVLSSITGRSQSRDRARRFWSKPKTAS